MWYHKPIVIFQNGLSNLTNLLWISKIDWKLHKQINAIVQCSLKNHWNVVICKTTARQSNTKLDVFLNNAMLNQKKQCSAWLSQQDCSFQKIDQLDWNHKPICKISKVCVNLIPNLKYHNPELTILDFFCPKIVQIICDCVCVCDCSSNVN